MQVLNLDSPPVDLTSTNVATWDESARYITVDIQKINGDDTKLKDVFIDIIIAVTTAGGISDKIVLRLHVFDCSSPNPGYVNQAFGYLTNTNTDLVLEFPENILRSVMCTPYQFYITDGSGDTLIDSSFVSSWLTVTNAGTECAQNTCLTIGAASVPAPVVITGKRCHHGGCSLVSESFTISICTIEKPTLLYNDADPLVYPIPSSDTQSLVFNPWVMQPVANNAGCPTHTTNVVDPSGPNVSNLIWDSSLNKMTFNLPSHTTAGVYELKYQASFTSPQVWLHEEPFTVNLCTAPELLTPAYSFPSGASYDIIDDAIVLDYTSAGTDDNKFFMRIGGSLKALETNCGYTYQLS